MTTAGPGPGVVSHVTSIDTASQPEGESWRALATRGAERLFPELDNGN